MQGNLLLATTGTNDPDNRDTDNRAVTEDGCTTIVKKEMGYVVSHFCILIPGSYYRFDFAIPAISVKA